MSTEGVITSFAGNVATVTLDRPTARNSLGPEVLAGIAAAVSTAASSGCTVMVIRGRGPALCAGADLPHLRSLGDDEAAINEYISSIGRVMDAIEQAPFISVCVVEGFALAGGCELMLACDLAIASNEAHIGDRHLEYGLLPGAGGSVRIAEALPAALAKRLLYTGEILNGREAAEIGLVGWAVPQSELAATVHQIVERLSRHSPAALRTMKRLYARVLDVDRRAALDAEVETCVDHLARCPDVREGLAAFVEKRAPIFQQADR